MAKLYFRYGTMGCGKTKNEYRAICSACYERYLQASAYEIAGTTPVKSRKGVKNVHSH